MKRNQLALGAKETSRAVNCWGLNLLEIFTKGEAVSYINYFLFK